MEDSFNFYFELNDGKFRQLNRYDVFSIEYNIGDKFAGSEQLALLSLSVFYLF